MDLSLLISPVWVLLLLNGAIIAFISNAVFGPGICRLIALIGAGFTGAAAGQIVSDMLGWRWVQMGDWHIFQTVFGSILLVMVARHRAIQKAIGTKGA